MQISLRFWILKLPPRAPTWAPSAHPATLRRPSPLSRGVPPGAAAWAIPRCEIRVNAVRKVLLFSRKDIQRLGLLIFNVSFILFFHGKLFEDGAFARNKWRGLRILDGTCFHSNLVRFFLKKPSFLKKNPFTSKETPVYITFTLTFFK